MNTNILKTLPRDKSTSASYATIARLDGKAAWEFLLLPSEIQWSKAASYQSANTGGSIPLLQYASSSGWSVSMSFPVMTGGDSIITEYVDKLAALLLPENGAPPPLYWQWSQRRLSPCVLVKFDKKENLWTKDGQLLSCQLDIVLVEVNEKQLIA